MSEETKKIQVNDNSSLRSGLGLSGSFCVPDRPLSAKYGSVVGSLCQAIRVIRGLEKLDI